MILDAVDGGHGHIMSQATSVVQQIVPGAWVHSLRELGDGRSGGAVQKCVCVLSTKSHLGLHYIPHSNVPPHYLNSHLQNVGTSFPLNVFITCFQLQNNC